MLTKEEEDFIKSWEMRRLQKKKLFRFSLGLPMGVMIVVALFANLAVGWHKGAASVIHNDSSVILVVLVAAIGIVAFMTIFTGNYQHEQNEQRYQELLAKKRAAENNHTGSAVS